MTVVAVVLEVMDKEWPAWWTWLVFLSFGGAAFFLGQRSLLAGIGLLGFIAILGLSTHQELTDPVLGSMIVAEAGRGYVVQSYAAIALGVGLALAGLALGVRRKVGGWCVRRRLGIDSARPA